MRLTDRSLYRKLFFNPELHAGEAYMDGRMRFEDSTLRDFLTLFSINRLVARLLSAAEGAAARLARRCKRFQQANPVGKAQKNVAHHYDLGNDFYKLFLDEGMQYSCAYFLDDDDTLEEAQQQQAAADRRQAQPQARPARSSTSAAAGAISRSISRRWRTSTSPASRCRRSSMRCRTRRRASAGLADRVRFELRDYRDVTERFDRIVSVGMFEHVGVQPLRRVLRQGERR